MQWLANILLVAELGNYFCFLPQPEYKIADPICTFIFSVLVLVTTILILRDAIQVLMEGMICQSYNEKKSIVVHVVATYILISDAHGAPTLLPLVTGHLFHSLKTVDTIGNCQRIAFTVAVSDHMHKITNL